MIKSSITDIPRDVKNKEEDNFGITPFENGLTKFITNSNTPITIALQGEWGSGKTSLMNSLNKSLCDGGDSKFHSIWLNTWEYALMKDAQSTLIDIITKLIQKVSEVTGVGKTQKDRLINGIKNIGISALRIGGAFHSASSAVADEIEKNGANNDSATIGEIRDELEKIIIDFLANNKRDGFIFFIDDLDRIDPPIAVQLLELLKNIFTLKNCIFVLAIDYDVVIKGLEPKFGKLSELNEREFRSFFDKIIQVPFSMPVSSYKSDDFLKASLLSIDYLNQSSSEDPLLISKFSEISNLSVGKNPRALKRLMNSLSLISCINSTKVKTEDEEDNQLDSELELLVNFALVSIQIAYPPVYRLLSLHPDFVKWDESIALQMNLKTLDHPSIEKLNLSQEFDDEWEKILFRLCEKDHYLKKNALNISRLLNSLKNSIEEKEEGIEDTIGAIISLSSVTNLEAFDKPVVDYHKGNLLKEIRKRIFPVLRNKLPNNVIKQEGSKILTNFKFRLNTATPVFEMNSNPKDGGVNLAIKTRVNFGKTIKDFKTDLKNIGLFKEFEVIINDYNNHYETNSDFSTRDLFNAVIEKKIYFVTFYSNLLLPTTADFHTADSIEKISDHIIKLEEFRSRVQELAVKRNI
jgi:hypothetical protein